MPELEKRHRVIVYDLRGLGLSGLPRRAGYRARSLSEQDFAIENHVLDLEAVLEAEGVERAALIGHSMGGQVILEAYRHIPDRISALVLLTAAYESPTRTLYGRNLDPAFRAIELAIRALPCVLRRVPEAKLEIVGDGPYREALQALTKRLDLRDHVEFLGPLGHRYKVETLNRAMIAVAPSPKEGWGLTVIEANACGAPVIQ